MRGRCEVPMGVIEKHSTKIRFVAVGLWNTVVGYLIFLLLESVFARVFAARYLAYMSAMVIAQVLAVMNAYVFHKYITFRSPARGMQIAGEFLRFSATYVVTFVVSLLLLPVFVEFFHLDPKVAGALVIICCTAISYLGHSKFSFRHRGSDGQ
jgi:putative flippase GtrA